MKITLFKVLFISGALMTSALALGADNANDASNSPNVSSNAQSQNVQEKAKSEVHEKMMNLSSSDIKNVQQALNDKGYDAGKADGVWGAKSQRAVKDFQKAQGEQPTGQLDQRTIAALGVKVGPHAQAGTANQPSSSSNGSQEQGSSNGY